MKRFTQKPVVFEAVQWSGSNWHQVLDFAGGENVSTDGKDLFLRVSEQRTDIVPVGNWLIRDEGSQESIVSLSEEALRAGWEELHDE